jgi:hypothetical protein
MKEIFKLVRRAFYGGKEVYMEIVMVDICELLTAEQKKKVAVMRMDEFIKILEIKISGMKN